MTGSARLPESGKSATESSLLGWSPVLLDRRGSGAALDVAHKPRALWKEVAVLLLVAVLLALLVRALLFEVFFIPSESMEATLAPGERVAVSSFPLDDGDTPERGDVVVFQPTQEQLGGRSAPDEPVATWFKPFHAILQAVHLIPPSTEDYIKRVVALPGETVEGRDGAVYINGTRLVEPYLGEGSSTGAFESVVVPEGTVWVMGDNRSNSRDSRYIGPISLDQIEGRAVMRVWPLNRVSRL